MEEIIKIAKQAKTDAFVTDKGCYISKRDSHGMIITDNDIDFACLDASNIIAVARNSNMNKEFATHMAIYQALPTVKAITHLKPKFCNIASKINITPRASCELYAEAMGKKLNMSTSIPERLVETLLKSKECLVLNGGLYVLGNSLESTYNRAKIIEKAVFTYIACKAVDKRISSRQLPCDKLKSKALTRDYDFSDNLCGARVGFSKLKEKLQQLDEDNTCILADMPIFVGIFANSTLDIDGVTSVEYGDLDNKKYLNNLASLANTEGVLLLKGRGLLIVDDDVAHAKATFEKIENFCKQRITELIQRGLNDTSADIDMLAVLMSKKLNLKTLPIL